MSLNPYSRYFDLSRQSRRLLLATDTYPGSPERIRIYSERASQCRSVHADDDLREDARTGPLLTRLRNGIVKVKTEPGPINVGPGLSLPARIRILRRRRGFSQRLLAAEMGTSRTLIQYWESGRNKPSFRMLQLLAETLQVPIGSLCN